MALQTAIDKLNAARATYDQQLAELGQNLGAEVALHLGAHIPEGFVVEWTQGTPSFNDGDPCRFSVHDAWIYRVIPDEKGNDPYEGENAEERGYRELPDDERRKSFALGSRIYGREWTTYSGEVRQGESVEGLSVEQFDALSAAWKVLTKDLLERAFGDGSHIFVSPGGKFKVTDYCDY